MPVNWNSNLHASSQIVKLNNLIVAFLKYCSYANRESITELYIMLANCMPDMVYTFLQHMHAHATNM